MVYEDEDTKSPGIKAAISMLLRSPDYTLRDVINTINGFRTTYTQRMVEGFAEVQLEHKLTRLDIPVTFIHGRHDVHVHGQFVETAEMILETERLQLRQMNQADYPDLCEILQDEEVMYAYDRKFEDADVQAWLDRQNARYQEYGFGLWAVILKDTGEFVGQAGLTMQPCDGEEVLEIGYLFKKAHWHHGYATEAAQGCKRYAFDILHENKVHAIIKSDNMASQRVASNLGMAVIKEFVKPYQIGDMLHYLYAVEK